MAQNTFLQLARIAEIIDSTKVDTVAFRHHFGSPVTAEELRFVQSLSPEQREALYQIVVQRVFASVRGYQYPERLQVAVSVLYADSANKMVPIPGLVRIAALQIAGALAEDVAAALNEARHPPARIRLRSEFTNPTWAGRDSMP
jgi:hypothetical protein